MEHSGNYAKQIQFLKGKYCNSLSNYTRFLTREVSIGDIALGANNPIRIQSMTTTDTMNTMATVEQTIRMVEAGCEYVRITAPSMKEAQNLQEIKKELRKRGYNVPLIADIHFTPNAAELAARLIEKVRVNPGNYVDKKKFQQIEYTQTEYDAEIERIRKRFEPLVKVCKEYGTAMRIGTNHGSLSDRIMSWYGDTPLGMVESAMEFMRICADLNYHNLVISMKASNTQIMVQAYRLLVETMVKEGMNYPLHLGVTEAGDGEDGRIKSAVGIGTLLEDGLGDTIRVSLTEEPEFEAPVAISLAQRYEKRKSANTSNPEPKSTINPYEYNRRKTQEVLNLGASNVPRVFADLSTKNLKDSFVLKDIGYAYSALLDKYNLTEMAADFVFLGDNLPSFSLPGNLKQVYNYTTWAQLKDKSNAHPLITYSEFSDNLILDAGLNFISADVSELDVNFFKLLQLNTSIVPVITAKSEIQMSAIRSVFFQLLEQNIATPVVIKVSFDAKNLAVENPNKIQCSADENLQLYAATDLGALLLDGFGEAIWLDAPNFSSALINSTSYGILQATRTRISKTEYISCPSCGRTLFDLQETTQLIRSRTDHLKGVKIGIMGCIVNGPGEMADADYGYVGTGPGKITLYKGKEVMRKNVDTEFAVDELIELIKEDGNWIEPKVSEIF